MGDVPLANAFASSTMSLLFIAICPSRSGTEQTSWSTFGGILVACPQSWLCMTRPAAVERSASSKLSDNPYGQCLEWLRWSTLLIAYVDWLVATSHRCGKPTCSEAAMARRRRTCTWNRSVRASANRYRSPDDLGLDEKVYVSDQGAPLVVAWNRRTKSATNANSGWQKGPTKGYSLSLPSFGLRNGHADSLIDTQHSTIEGLGLSCIQWLHPPNHSTTR